jgi:cysteinyl-tRNA synthetase
MSALRDDLNTPKALSHIYEMRRQVERYKDSKLASKLRASGRLLGLLQDDPEKWRHGSTEGRWQSGGSLTIQPVVNAEGYSYYPGMGPDQIKRAVELRMRAREQKNYPLADQVRESLLQVGVILEDRPDGTTDWRRA